MKVAYFAFNEKFPAPHAGYVHVNEITRNIAEMGVDIVAYVKSPKSFLISDKRNGNRTIKYVKFPFLTKSDFLSDIFCLPFSYYKIRKNIRKYDLIHERFTPLNIWSPHIIRDVYIPYLLEVNSPIAEEIKNKLLRSAAKRVRRLQLEKCDGIITQTNTLKEILSRFTDKFIFVISNGVDIHKFTSDKFSAEVREKYAANDEILVTFVGAFKRWHGVLQLPQVAEEVLADYENTRFLLVGEGPMYDEVRRTCTKLGDRMTFTGAVQSERIPRILACSDILIAPFDTTGYKALEKYGFWWCPVKLFEYMASGRPIVSYGFGEVRKIVNGAGLLAQPGAQREFIGHLCSLIENEKMRKKLGKRGRKLAVENYDWSERARETVEVYERFI